ncbi:hypothetical protein [Pontibacter russatus]|uniref:hypothetical protein n=1 Tax=Pontibacter russatus TaxID=2694929 RepID=UPI00137B49C8|nr:hypothetical protein [Pontibacter russatus]
MEKWFALLFVALVHFGCSDNTSMKDVSEAQKEWVQFESREGGYVINHPDYKVKKTDRVGYVPELGEYTVHLNIINSQNEDDENLGYSFSHTTYDEAVLPADKASIREKCKANVYKKAETLKAKVDFLNFYDYKGIEVCEAQISLEHQPVVLQVRLFIVDQTEYELYVVMSDSDIFNPSAQKFFNSFEIKGKTTKL